MANICLTQNNVKSLNWGGDAQVETNSKLCTIGYSLLHFGASRKSEYKEDEYPDNRIVTGSDQNTPIEITNSQVVTDVRCSYLDGSTIKPLFELVLYNDGSGNSNSVKVCFSIKASGENDYRPVLNRNELNLFPSGVCGQEVNVIEDGIFNDIPFWRVSLANKGVYGSNDNNLIAIYVGTNPPPRDVLSSYCQLAAYVDEKLVTEIFPTYSITSPSAITSISLDGTTSRSNDIAVAVNYNNNTRDFIPYSSNSTNPDLNVTFTCTYGSLNYVKKSFQSQSDIQAYYVGRISNNNDSANLNFKYTGNHHTINLNPATAQIRINNSFSKTKISVLFQYIGQYNSKVFIEDTSYLDKIYELYGVIHQLGIEKLRFNVDLNGEWIESTAIDGFKYYQVVVGSGSGGDIGSYTQFGCEGSIKYEYRDYYELEDKTQHER